MDELVFRQVHLDFHTSGEIPDVGAAFDADEFVATLKAAHVNSVTCFAKGHHGYSYYATQVGVRHPHLTRDLLGEQVEACHRAGIRVPAYLSVVWDEHAAAHHQEWLQVNREGRQVGRAPLERAGWRWLCLNTPYVEYVAAQTEEILQRYPVDGLFFDIVKQTAPGCVCNACRARLAESGGDLFDDEALRRQSLAIEREFMRHMTTLVHRIRPRTSVFYNSRLRLSADPEMGVRHEIARYTHVEIESLPSGQWGYNHYPLFARYFQTLGRDLMGMTARFHKSWADFGGLKNRAALEYECFAMLATGAKCSIGDQLHPSGRLERPAYERIGQVYASVAAKERWCRGASALAEIGVLLAQGQPSAAGEAGPSAAQQQDARDTDEGMVRLLLEGQRTFQFLDLEADLHDYRLVILPDSIVVGPALAVKLRDYLAQGGRLLLTGESGLDPTHHDFARKELGLHSLGPLPWGTAYFRVDQSGPLGRDIEAMEHVAYEPGWLVRPEPGTETLATVVPPYFNRDHQHFSSHAQTPPAVAPGAPLPPDLPPAVTKRGNVAYVAFPLGRSYRRHGNRVYRTLLLNLLDLLLPERMIETSLPTSGQATVLCQPAEGGRWVAHLLYYPAERRTPQIDIIEDVVSLNDVRLQVRTGFRPSRVYEAPSERHLAFEWQDGAASVVLPQLAGHAMVVFEP